jgi:large subunit ribosomal protein L23
MSIFGATKTKEEKKKDEKKSPKVGNAKKSAPAAKKSMKDLYGAGKEKEKVSSSAAVSADKAEGKPEIKKDTTASSSAYRVLIRPLVTEKGSHLGVQNKYLFEVDYNTNKIEVAKAIESAYGIKPTKVNIIKLAGKVIRRGRTEGRRKNWKKAIVTLPEGKTIQIYEGI